MAAPYLKPAASSEHASLVRQVSPPIIPGLFSHCRNQGMIGEYWLPVVFGVAVGCPRLRGLDMALALALMYNFARSLGMGDKRLYPIEFE